MNDISKEIRTLFLPAAFIKDGYVRIKGKKGDDTYEDYLRELLNESEHFMMLTEGEKLERPLVEYNGENDAVSEKYSIDFKLILGHSAQLAIANTSYQISTNKDKSIYFYNSPMGKGEYSAVRLHSLLRNYSKNALEEIIAGEYFQNKNIGHIEKTDIKCYLKSLMYNKNLLLFYPVIFYLVDKSKIKASGLCEFLFTHFKNSLIIRKEKYPGYDTYFATIFEKKLMLLKYENNELAFVENIDLEKSTTFARIKGYYDSNLTVRTYL